MIRIFFFLIIQHSFKSFLEYLSFIRKNNHRLFLQYPTSQTQPHHQKKNLDFLIREDESHFGYKAATAPFI